MMANESDAAKRILIVEDDEDMWMIYKQIFLDRSGEYEIELTADPVRALEEMEKDNFNLILLDIIMEPMRGDELFIRLRENKITVPVIFVSVCELDDMKDLQGIDHFSFLKKPISKERLFEEIERVLGAV